MNRWIFIGLVALCLAGLAALAPRALDKANEGALAALDAGNPYDAAKTFELLARFGHLDAINNLGVIRLRGLDGIRDREEGRALLERAEASGHLVAG